MFLITQSVILGKTGIIIQVRTGSKRLPGKMILPFYRGRSMLELILEKFLTIADKDMPVVVATSDNPKDDEIENIARKNGINCFKGSENDVLDRFIRAAEKFNLDFIIRVCADNPLFDINGTIALTSYASSGKWDYIGYKLQGDRPSILTHSGFWGEVVTLSALKKAHEQTTEPIYREHVTNYIHRHPGMFNVRLIRAPEFLFCRDDVRFTVDTEEDFRMMQDLYRRLMEENISLDPESIVNFVDRHAEYILRMKRQIELNRKA